MAPIYRKLDRPAEFVPQACRARYSVYKTAFLRKDKILVVKQVMMAITDYATLQGVQHHVANITRILQLRLNKQQ